MSPRSRRRVLALALVSTTSLCGALAPVAAAELGPIQLVSKSSREQAAFAREPALNGNGRYVVFDGELGGRTGLFRKDLETGALILVVEGAAEAPSISADGSEVSFTTTQALEPAADGEAGTSDVYVADLTAAVPEYELVSAANGQRMPGSSSAAPRVALSSDGSEVAFVNSGEVYVRKLAEPEPILISARRDPAGGAMTSEPVPGGGAFQPAGAALSADGNAVGWVGEHLREQVPLLRDEKEDIEKIEAGGAYREPLWRSVPTATEPAPRTRRIVGGGDPLAAGCPAGGTSEDAACVGPFPSLTEDHTWEVVSERGVGKGWGVDLPQLSADGSMVAVVGSPEEIEDLFVVEMRPGLSRVQAVHQLTRWTNPAPSLRTPRPLVEQTEYLGLTGAIRECAISPDGEHIAFTTQRQSFPLSPPTLITAKPVPLPTVAELYQLNLEPMTIERVTPGPGTGISLAPGSAVERSLGPSTVGAASPSYSDDDRTLAFASAAYNLVTGDANEGSDVFTVESKPPAPVQASTISSRPSSLSIPRAWRLTVHAVSRPDGAVRVIASVPGAGTLRAMARSNVGSNLRLRTVGSAHRRIGFAGVMRLELRLPPGLRGLAHHKGGLYTSLELRFSGPGGKPLQQRLAARFRAHSPKPKAGGKSR